MTRTKLSKTRTTGKKSQDAHSKKDLDQKDLASNKPSRTSDRKRLRDEETTATEKYPKRFRGGKFFELNELDEPSILDRNRHPAYRHRMTFEYSDSEKSYCCVQIPNKTDLKAFKGMPTGLTDDQQQRITKMSNVLKEDGALPIIKTNAEGLEAWFPLFEAIDQGDLEEALKAFDGIEELDPIKHALLGSHSIGYVQQVIEACINPKKKLDSYGDVKVNRKTFEAIIKDIASTINNFEQYRSVISLGLPTHHAHAEEASGFCIFNKVAILIHYFKQENIIICGLDVNADDGLRDILEQSPNLEGSYILHLDSYDVRVYPWTYLAELKGNYHYTPLYLNEAKYKKEGTSLHPIMELMLRKVRKACENNPSNTGIYLTLGFDSHVNETADCGKSLSYEQGSKFIQGKKLQNAEARTCRYSAEDFKTFYAQLNNLIEEFNIPFCYVGIEGGYNKKVNNEEILALSRSFQARAALNLESPPLKMKGA